MDRTDRMKKPVIQVSCKGQDSYNRFKNDMLRDFRRGKYQLLPLKAKDFDPETDERIRSIDEISFGSSYCGQEYLDIFASFVDLNNAKMQVIINGFLAKKANSDMAFFILPSTEKLKPCINVLGDTPLLNRLDFTIDERLYPEFYLFKHSLSISDMKDQDRWMINRLAKIDIKTFMATPIYTKPRAEKALFLMGLANKHLIKSIPPKIQVSLERNCNLNNVLDFSEFDESLVYNAMKYFSIVAEYFICSPPENNVITKGLTTCFKICKELLKIEQTEKAMLSTLLIHAFDLLETDRCALYFPKNYSLEGIIYSRYGLDFKVTTVLVPNDFSTCGYAYHHKQLLNVDTQRDLHFYQEANLSSKWITKHVLSIPIKKSSNEVIAILEFYNKFSLSSGFDKEDEIVADFIGNICLFCLVMKSE